MTQLERATRFAAAANRAATRVERLCNRTIARLEHEAVRAKSTRPADATARGIRNRAGHPPVNMGR